jgi:hypothetical protein
LVAGGRSGGGGGGGDGSGQRRRRRRKRGGGSGSGGKMTKAAAVILFCGGTGLPEIHICDWVMHACIYTTRAGQLLKQKQGRGRQKYCF